MTNDEIIERDFQIMTAKGLMHNAALLRTIVQTNMVIIEILQKTNNRNNTNYDMNWMNDIIDTNTKFIEDAFKNDTPLFKDITPPIKND